VRKILDKRILY